MALDFGKLSFALGVVGFLFERREKRQLLAQLDGRRDPAADDVRRRMSGLPPAGPAGTVDPPFSGDAAYRARPFPQPGRASLPRPPVFPPHEVAMMTERRQGAERGARWFREVLRVGTPGVSSGIPGYLAGLSAEHVPDFFAGADTWRVVPPRPGLPRASDVLSTRLGEGLAALGSLSLVMIGLEPPPGEEPPTMVLVFTEADRARAWSRSGDFALLAAPDPVEAPVVSQPESQPARDEIAEEIARDAARSVDGTLPGDPEGRAAVFGEAADVAASGTPVADGQTVEVAPGVIVERDGERLEVRNTSDAPVRVSATKLDGSNGMRVKVLPPDVAPSPTLGDAE